MTIADTFAPSSRIARAAPPPLQLRTPSANGAANAEGADTFVRVPQSMTMDELRQVTQASLHAMNPAASQKIDPKKIPFGIEIEMEHFNQNDAQPFIQNLPPWNIRPDITNWKVVPDLSLSSKTGGEAVSPPMTLENGEAEKQIREVFTQLKALGGRSTRNCAFHVHVDARALGEKGLMSLMMMALEQEHAIFRISQNGYHEHRGTLPGHGYRHDTPYYYCKPLAPALGNPFSLLHADSVNEFRNNLYGAIPADPARDKHGNLKHPRPSLPDVNSRERFRPHHRDSVRYFGINFNSYWYRGTIEFRLFEGTDDPDQAVENIQMVLGMVAAAADGSYAYMKTNPLGTQQNVPVSKEAFNYFLNRVAFTPAHRDRLMKTFQASGGILQDDAPVTDPTVMHTAFAMMEGYQFAIDNKRVHSPFEIADEVKSGRRNVSAITPQSGVPVHIAGIADLQRLAADIESSLNFSAGDRNRLHAAASALRNKGFFFTSGPSSKAPGIHLVSDAQVLSAISRKELIVSPTAAPQERQLIDSLDLLERLTDLECHNTSAPDCQELDGLRDRLQTKGAGLVALNGNAPVPLVSLFATIDAVKKGTAQCPIGTNGHPFIPVASLDDVRRAANIMHDRTEGLDADSAKALRLLAGLSAKGLNWTSSDVPNGSTLNRLGQIEKLRNGTLVASTPSRVMWNWGYRKRAAVANLERLERLGAKFGVTVDTAPAAPKAEQPA